MYFLLNAVFARRRTPSTTSRKSGTISRTDTTFPCLNWVPAAFAGGRELCKPNLSVQEDRLRFFFAARSNGTTSLAWPLYDALKSGIRYGRLQEEEKLGAIRQTISRFLDIPESALRHVCRLDDLIRYLLKSGCTEDVKWVCTALYYSMDDYLEELDVILRKATGLFLEHLPDVAGVCRRTARLCPGSN